MSQNCLGKMLLDKHFSMIQKLFLCAVNKAVTKMQILANHSSALKKKCFIIICVSKKRGSFMKGI